MAAPLQDALAALFSGPVSSGARSLLAALHADHPLIVGLVVDGIIGGVGMLLTFVPLMAVMFALLALLEDSGYLARAAVVADRMMRALGLLTWMRRSRQDSATRHLPRPVTPRPPPA